MNWLALNNLVHSAEQMRVPFPSSKAVMWATIIGIPVAVLLHETSDSWLPESTNIPILAWFLRQWAVDGQAKKTHLRIFRNLAVFTWIVAIMAEKTPMYSPIDYVAGRVLSTNARKSLTEDIYAARRASFGSVPEVLSEEVFDEAVSRQQRDAALRRRQAKEESRQ